MGVRGRTPAVSRGGIARKRGSTRPDRDGDLDMDSAARPRGGGITKAKSVSSTTAKQTARSSKGGAITTTANSRLRNDIQRHLASSERSKNAMQNSSTSYSARGSEDLRVSGWRDSKASTSEDGGVSTLVVWLEKKATLKSHTKAPVKIIKTRLQDDDLILTIPSENIGALLRLDGYVFAGRNLKIQRLAKGDRADPTERQSVEDMLKRVIDRRFNAATKLLNLSALGDDPDLKTAAVFDSKSTTEKFFLALIKVLRRGYPSDASFHSAVQSVSLASNALPNVAPVTQLAQYLPGLLNLDLSNNAIATTAAIEAWRHRFPKLDHLLINNNPLEQAESDYAQTFAKWYPRLRHLNGIQIRSDEEAARASQVGDLPFPLRSPHFQDEGQIAETFIRNFFTGFDTDRAKLAELYYDANSDFSLSVNVSAPRDPTANAQTPQEWGSYIKQSRNLTKITHLTARQARHSRGMQAVKDSWAALPMTRHPDLAAEPSKWLIECQLQPGLPDPAAASPGGVDGFLITIHGQYDELDPSNHSRVVIPRSFDRTIILGPGGPSGVRVVNDMLVLRAFGGTQAYSADPHGASGTTGTDLDVTAAPTLPPGLTIEAAEQLVLELQKQTTMTVEYAKDCLEQVQWDLPRAVQAFAAVRESLPPAAFVRT